METFDTNHVDLYCERLGPGLLAEPLNAITNIAFVISGFAIWRLAHQSGGSNLEIKTLAVIAASIGIGSGLFHTFATPWTRTLDVTPILVFQLMFVWFYAHKAIGWGRIPAGILAASVLATSLIARDLPQLVSGSLNYLPALLVVLALGVYHRFSNKPSPLILLVASGLFCLSLMFRTYDEILCTQLPHGIHFLWHITNAVVLYLCARALFDLGKSNPALNQNRQGAFL